MLPTTVEAVKAILGADNTVTPVQRETILAAVRAVVGHEVDGISRESRIRDPSGYIRGKEAAEYLGVSIRTLHAWKARAIIPCHKMAHRVCLYRKVDLDKAVGRFRLNAIGETSLRKRTY